MHSLLIKLHIWLHNEQSRTEQSFVYLVGTISDRYNLSDSDKLVFGYVYWRSIDKDELTSFEIKAIRSFCPSTLLQTTEQASSWNKSLKSILL